MSIFAILKYSSIDLSSESALRSLPDDLIMLYHKKALPIIDEYDKGRRDSKLSEEMHKCFMEALKEYEE